MANVINAQNGMANTADSSSVLHIQTGGTNAIEIDASQNATLVNRVTLPAQKVKVNAIGTQSTASATVTINLATHTIHTITLAAATTFAFSNVPGAGESQVVYLRITNGGSQAITWPAGATKYAGGTPPQLTTSGVDVLGILYDIATTSYMLFVIGLDVK